MAPRILLLIFLSVSAWSLSCLTAAATEVLIKTQVKSESSNLTSRGVGIELPGFNEQQHHQAGCGPGNRRAQLLENQPQQDSRQNLKVSLRHRDAELRMKHKLSHKSLLLQSLKRDSFRVTSFKSKINQNAFIRSNPRAHLYASGWNLSESKVTRNDHLQAESTVESGASLGAGEYVMDVVVGNPPQHFSLIIDTGSDLSWFQCKPCNDCYDQAGPMFDPTRSASYKPVACSSPACGLVTHSNCPAGRADQSRCEYLYSYGDSSQTSGDLAVETLSIDLSSEHPDHQKKTLEIRDMVIGCGHNNKGLFQGAGGLIGLGQGALSFSSQLKSSSIGHGFSYCLVDRTSNMSTKSVISFGDDMVLSKSFSSMSFTPFVKTNTSVDTFYYLGIRGLKVDNETLSISPNRFAIAENGTGGTIIDSGTTITYLDSEAYQELEKALLKRIKYPRADPFDVLGICYNASGIVTVSFPELSILFENGAELQLPQRNYFIQPDPEDPIHCLAIVPTKGLSLIGNFQQQDIHLLYDLENSRLGFARTNCASKSL